MLKITATQTTPEINFDTVRGLLHISGRSIGESAHDFYQPLLEKIEEYVKRPCPQTVVHLKLVYFNNSTSRSILDVLRRLEVLDTKCEVSINWYYEVGDGDMMEVGEDYREMVRLPFRMIEVEKF